MILASIESLASRGFTLTLVFIGLLFCRRLIIHFWRDSPTWAKTLMIAIPFLIGHAMVRNWDEATAIGDELLFATLRLLTAIVTAITSEIAA